MKRVLSFAISDSSAIPYDLDTYQFLCSHSIFSTKFNINYLPSLKDLFNCSIKQIPFQSIFDNAMKKTEAFWLSEPSSKLVVKDKECFVLTASLSESNKERMKKVETAWRNFFARWGYHSSFMYDETQTKCKITVRHEHTSQPEIKVAEELKQVKSDAKLLLGGVLELSIMDYDGQSYIHIEDIFSKKTLYNLHVKAQDSGLLARLIDIANASSKN